MDKTTIDLIDKITELLGNSDGQSPEEIEKELSEDGVDVDKVKKELLEFRINTAIVAKNVYAERARCLKAVDDEPELPEEMPQDIRAHIYTSATCGQWAEVEEICRKIVRCTKNNIRKRIYD